MFYFLLKLYILHKLETQVDGDTFTWNSAGHSRRHGRHRPPQKLQFIRRTGHFSPFSMGQSKIFGHSWVQRGEKPDPLAGRDYHRSEATFDIRWQDVWSSVGRDGQHCEWQSTMVCRHISPFPQSVTTPLLYHTCGSCAVRASIAGPAINNRMRSLSQDLGR